MTSDVEKSVAGRLRRVEDELGILRLLAGYGKERLNAVLDGGVAAREVLREAVR